MYKAADYFEYRTLTDAGCKLILIVLSPHFKRMENWSYTY